MPEIPAGMRSLNGSGKFSKTLFNTVIWNMKNADDTVSYLNKQIRHFINLPEIDHSTIWDCSHVSLKSP